MKTALLFAGVLLVTAIVMAQQSILPAAPQKTATPGQPQTTVVFTQSREEVRLRGLENDIRALRAEIEALKERVATLEAGVQE